MARFNFFEALLQTRPDGLRRKRGILWKDVRELRLEIGKIRFRMGVDKRPKCGVDFQLQRIGRESVLDCSSGSMNHLEAGGERRWPCIRMADRSSPTL